MGPGFQTAILGCIAALVVGLVVVLSLVFFDRRIDPLGDYCYGVRDLTGEVYPSAEPVYYAESAGAFIAKVPGEQVVYVFAPASAVIDTECVCERNLEPGACEREDD